MYEGQLTDSYLTFFLNINDDYQSMAINKPLEAIEIQVNLCNEEEEKGSTVGSPFVVDILSSVGGQH